MNKHLSISSRNVSDRKLFCSKMARTINQRFYPWNYETITSHFDEDLRKS